MKLVVDETNHYPIPKDLLPVYEYSSFVENGNVYLNRVISNTKENYYNFITTGDILASELLQAIYSDSTLHVIQSSRFQDKQDFDVIQYRKNECINTCLLYNEIKSGLLVVFNRVYTDSTKAEKYYQSVESNFHEISVRK